MAKYSKIAILFHWLIAILIGANILLANWGEDLPRAARAAYMSPHKAIGISILILTVGRILWRLANRPPALPDKVTGWQAKAGHSAHILFYVLMIVVPLTGGAPTLFDVTVTTREAFCHLPPHFGWTMPQRFLMTWSSKRRLTAPDT